MAKHWTQITREAKHFVSESRRLFLLEHQKADQIVVNNDGVPVQAIYFSAELPGYGKPHDEVPMPTRNIKDVEAAK